jgi:hypothetical protein
MTRALKQAIDAAPANMAKLSKGKAPSHARKRFKAYTVSALLEQYRDPRAILLEIASTDTATLAKQMNATLADALAERRLCAQAVLPYVAQKLPVQVDMRHTRAIVLNIVDERQYQELVEVAATEADDTDSFSMQLLPATSEDAGNETPVTPPVAVPPTEAE